MGRALNKNPEDIYSKARENMVLVLAERGINDPFVLDAMRRIPRHMFVEEAFIPQAYNAFPLPIGNKQSISQPYMVALMTEALKLRGAEKVLEIGAGSGYQSALLSALADRVFSIERISGLAATAKKNLDRLSCPNVQVRYGDGTLGWPDEAPFDAIISAASSPEVPQTYIEQLGENGILVMPVGAGESQDLVRVVKRGAAVIRERISACRFVRLVGRHGWEA